MSSAIISRAIPSKRAIGWETLLTRSEGLGWRDQRDIYCYSLAGLTLLIFWRVVTFDFVNFDDPSYVTRNPRVSGGISLENLAWAFSTLNGGTSYWHPLTWISHQLDCELFGLNAAAHHLTNLLIHLANVLLLWHFLARATGHLGRAAIVSALFAWHPLHVESVAWISERKDLLCGFFWLGTMLSYAGYATSGGRWRYWRTFLLFALALMSKPMAVTLPFALLLLDFWPLRRWTPAWLAPIPEEAQHQTSGSSRGPGGIASLIREKLPFLLLSVILCVATIAAQRQLGAIVSLQHLGLGERISNAVMACFFYLSKTVWPSGLCALYPHTEYPWQHVLLAGVALMSLSLAAVALARSDRSVLFGWLWFLGTLLPVVGLVQVGPQAMADRYTYLPLIGIFIAITWGGAELVKVFKWPIPKLFLAAGTTLLLGLFAVCTFNQMGFWKNSIVLFQRALEIEPRNMIAHNNLGLALARSGDVQSGMAHYRAALRINSHAVHPNVNLGDIFMQKGQVKEAIQYYSQAISVHQDVEYAHNGLAYALEKAGRTGEAIEHYGKALKLRPDMFMANYNLARILATDPRDEFRDPRRAITLATRAAAEARDGSPAPMDILAAAYAAGGEFDRAVRTAEQAVQLAENSADRSLRTNIQARLNLYRAGKAYYEPTATNTLNILPEAQAYARPHKH